MRVLLDYVLTDVIATGALTEVHRGRRLPGDDPVAVKVARADLDATGRARAEVRLRAEGRALRQAAGPGVVPLVEVVDGSDGGGGRAVAVVTRWSEVGSLDRWLAGSAHPTSCELVGMGGELMAALAGAAERGLAHPRPTLDHLLVGPAGELWLTGFAHAVASADAAAALAAVRPVAESTLLALAEHLEPPPLPPWTPPVAAVPRPLPRRARRAPPPSGQATPALGRGPGPGRRRREPGRRRREPGRRRRQAGRLGAALGAGLVAVIAVVAGTRALALGSGARPSLGPRAPATTAAPDHHGEPAPLCAGPRFDAPAGAVVVTGDLEGRHCTDEVRWWPALAEVERRDPSGSLVRFHLGRPGDQLLLGDWDHDGRATPGLYDPASGEVDRFDGWATPGASLTATVDDRTGRRDGVARVTPMAAGDVITVAAR